MIWRATWNWQRNKSPARSSAQQDFELRWPWDSLREPMRWFREKVSGEFIHILNQLIVEHWEWILRISSTLSFTYTLFQLKNCDDLISAVQNRQSNICAFLKRFGTVEDIRDYRWSLLWINIEDDGFKRIILTLQYGLQYSVDYIDPVRVLEI